MGGSLEELRAAIGERYTIERELGRGGMAFVYLAKDLKHGRKVALKVLRPELTASLGAERFVREIQIASNLSHPHIVPLYDSGEADGFLYFVMPFIEGESLRDRLDRERQLTFEEAFPIVQQVSTALGYAHEHGVIHRDIKPENILFAGGEAVVADFGIARAISAAGGGDLTTSGLPLGTLGYMSPEQAAGSRVLDGRTDVYSLACVLYEALVGRPPGRWVKADELERGRLTGASPEERLQLDSLPPAVERALVKALAQDVEDRHTDPETFVAALKSAPEVAARVKRRRKRVALAIGSVLAMAIAVTLGLQLRSGHEVDANVVAVAPFEVFSSDLEQWGEGLVDMLSAKLDGAGPLKAVSPSVTIRQWMGRSEPATALSLGREVGAGLVIYGTLVATEGDSVRAQATLYDAAVRRVVADFDLSDHIDRVDRVADSLAVRLMRELSRRRSLGVWRLASLGSSSPAALKAFLRGEQHYRQFALDSARFYYEEAIELDSTFALAHSRRAISMGWSLHYDPEFVRSLLRAGALNHGLARRESLLLTADSIEGALSQFAADSTSWVLLDRLFETLEYAAQEYPLDPQVWYELGEARYHTGPFVGETNESVRDAFANAVGLDSSFVPAYRHLAELTLLSEGREAARRVIAEDLSRADSGMMSEALTIVQDVLDDAHADTELSESLENSSAETPYQAWYDLKAWPDSAETALQIARTWAASGTLEARATLVWSLGFRGHVQEVRELAGPGSFAGVQLARLGLVPRDTAAAVYEEWLRTSVGPGLHMALPWWAEQRDTVSILRALARWDSLATLSDPATAAVASYLTTVGQSYLALGRADTASALQQLEHIRVYPCSFCYQEQLTRARLLVATGRDREAVVLLDRMPFLRDQAPPIEAVVVALERGRVHERLGDDEEAIKAFTFVLDAWSNADSELQPMVEEARNALARLTAEPGG